MENSFLSRERCPTDVPGRDGQATGIGLYGCALRRSRSIRVHSIGGPETLKYEDVPDPVPAAGQALVQVQAAGVNFIAVYQRTGLYKVPLPFTLGRRAPERSSASVTA